MPKRKEPETKLKLPLKRETKPTPPKEERPVSRQHKKEKRSKLPKKGTNLREKSTAATLSQSEVPPPPTPQPVIISDEDEISQQCDAPVVEHEEEIVCEGEVEIQMSDDPEDGNCVDVETTIDEPESQSVPSTPTQTKTMQSKKLDADDRAKNNSSRLSTTPSTSKAAALAAAAIAAGSIANSANAKKRKGRRDSGTSSDEERWLKSIESGKIEEVDDEMKKIKNPKLMTARQRAMYERTMDKEPSPGGELLMSLPTGYKEKEKPQTAEDIQKAALKSQKRKQLADEKREKDKKKTMERLLKKQETKQRSTARNKNAKAAQPMISYRNTTEGATLSFPPDHDFPIVAQLAREQPKPQLCGIAGCNQLKVYNCSKTKLPLCSYACYRKNVQAIKQIMC